MEKEEFYLEEEVIIKPPYWWVEYIDECGYRHLAQIKDENYLKYLQDNYLIKDIRIIEA